MRLLLDTHVLLWWLGDDERLDESDVTREIATAANDVYVSAASAWEIGIKRALGKLTAPGDLEDELVRQRFQPLPVTIRHALDAGALPFHHRDPFDRLLVAQAQVEGLSIATRDPSFSAYGVSVVRA